MARTTHTQDEGFTPLFNGRDLTGWVYGRRASGEEHRAGRGYQVENGVLFSTKEDGGNLFTERQYSDFVLRFEFRLTENANDSIGIRAPLQGDAAYVGMEIQILDDSGSQYRNLRPAQYHGSVCNLFAPKRGFQKPIGEWNAQEITANGRRVTVVLNGTMMVDADLDDVKDEALLCGGAASDKEDSVNEGGRREAAAKPRSSFLSSADDRQSQLRLGGLHAQQPVARRARGGQLHRAQAWGCRGPLVIDARRKPHHAPPLERDPAVERRVDRLGERGASLYRVT